MATFDELREVRLAKLNKLKEKGVDPYPATSSVTHSVLEATNNFDSLSTENKIVTLGGRVMSIRAQGALIFYNFFDGTGTFQALIKKEESTQEAFELFNDVVDIGDFVETTGTLFVTRTGQKTVQVSSWRMLAKSLRPLPEKWHGLQDPDERFRRRYLDALMDEDVRNRFIARSKTVSLIREILNKENYLEVETPMLQPLYGGASAEPFTTHHNTLDMDLFLRISPELYLKRMIVAGFPRVYEISRNFRNEGIDVTHNPEFTMLEFYEMFSDSPKQMKFVEKMIRELVQKVCVDGKVKFDDKEIGISKPFNVVSYMDLLKSAGISDPLNISLEELVKKAESLGVAVAPGESEMKILDNIYKKVCRPNIVEPTFIVEYPADYLPLAKRNTENPKLVDAFQLVIAGVEMVKAFSELNDPIDQAMRFAVQESQKTKGEADAQRKDDDFIEAMEYGMPPMGGVGIGIDRLVMLLTNTRNIKEVIFFPTMKPR